MKNRDNAGLHIENRQIQYIARISHGKDSMKMLDVIISRGLKLDRITTTDIWATETIRGEYPETVNMSAEEFQKFMDWKKERDYYEKELVKETDKREFMAKKTTWAIEKDPKRPGKVKIVDQEHAAELLELANDYLS